MYNINIFKKSINAGSSCAQQPLKSTCRIHRIPRTNLKKKPTCIFIFCIFIHILIKLVSFFSETLTFNWVCITVIIKWKGNEVSVSATCHRYTLTLTWERVEGGLALPLMRHTMATTTQLTLSIYTTPRMHAHTHTHTHTHKQRGRRSEKAVFLFFFVLLILRLLTATPVCRTCEIRREELKTWVVWCQLVKCLVSPPVAFQTPKSLGGGETKKKKGPWS